MWRVVTQADVEAVPAGSVLAVEADAMVTPLAAEHAAARNVRIVRGDDPREVIRAITRAVVAKVGDAGPQVVEAVVGEVLAALQGGAGVEQERARGKSRAVLTTTGKNSKGIVARVTARIAELGGDILDISQTLVGGYFTMIIVIDVGSLAVSFEEFQEAIRASVHDLGCQAMMMHEDVLASLHRV